MGCLLSLNQIRQSESIANPLLFCLLSPKNQKQCIQTKYVLKVSSIPQELHRYIFLYYSIYTEINGYVLKGLKLFISFFTIKKLKNENPSSSDDLFNLDRSESIDKCGGFRMMGGLVWEDNYLPSEEIFYLLGVKYFTTEVSLISTQLLRKFYLPHFEKKRHQIV